MLILIFIALLICFSQSQDKTDILVLFLFVQSNDIMHIQKKESTTTLKTKSHHNTQHNIRIIRISLTVLFVLNLHTHTQKKEKKHCEIQ
jgi:hypothetical protein